MTIGWMSSTRGPVLAMIEPWAICQFRLNVPSPSLWMPTVTQSRLKLVQLSIGGGPQVDPAVSAEGAYKAFPLPSGRHSNRATWKHCLREQSDLNRSPCGRFLCREAHGETPKSWAHLGFFLYRCHQYRNRPGF